MTLIDLRLGRRRFDIRFWRDGKETLFEVLRGKRSAVELKAASALRKMHQPSRAVGMPISATKSAQSGHSYANRIP
jgi:hypothetical protein